MNGPRVMDLQNVTQLLLAIVACIDTNGGCRLFVHPDDQGAIKLDPLMEQALVKLASLGCLSAQTNPYLFRGKVLVMPPGPPLDHTFHWRGV